MSSIVCTNLEFKEMMRYICDDEFSDFINEYIFSQFYQDYTRKTAENIHFDIGNASEIIDFMKEYGLWVEYMNEHFEDAQTLFEREQYDIQENDPYFNYRWETEYTDAFMRA